MRTLFALCFVLACSSSKPPGDPQDPVERFYRALAAKDCDGMMRELASEYRKKWEQQGCDHLLEQLLERQLDVIVDTTVDGRNTKAHLVRVRLKGRTTELLLQVESEGGQWKIVSM